MTGVSVIILGLGMHDPRGQLGQYILNRALPMIAGQAGADLLSVLVACDGVTTLVPLSGASEVNVGLVCPPAMGAMEGDAGRLLDVASGILMQLEVDDLEVSRLVVVGIWDQPGSIDIDAMEGLAQAGVSTSVVHVQVSSGTQDVEERRLANVTRVRNLVSCELAVGGIEDAADVLVRFSSAFGHAELHRVVAEADVPGANAWPSVTSVELDALDLWRGRVEILRPGIAPLAWGGTWSRMSWGRYRPGHIEIAGVRAAHAYHCWSLDNGVSWSEWTDLGLGSQVARVELSTSVFGHLEVFALLCDGSISHRWLVVDPTSDRHDGWSGVHTFRGSEDSYSIDVAAGSIGADYQEVFGVDEGGTLWSRKWWNRNPWEWSSWLRWETPGPVMGVEASQFAKGLGGGEEAGAVVITLRTRTRFVQKWRHGWGWQGWNEVPHDVVASSRGLARTSGNAGAVILFQDGYRAVLPGRWIGILPEGEILTFMNGRIAVTDPLGNPGIRSEPSDPFRGLAR